MNDPAQTLRSRRALPVLLSFLASGALLAACGEGDGDGNGSGGTPSTGGTSAESGGSGSGGRAGTGGASVGGEGGLPVAVGGEGGALPVDVEYDCKAGVTDLQVAGLSSFVELCETAGPVRHLRIDGLVVGAPHGSSQLLFGFDEAPSMARGFEVGEGRANLLFYGGAPPYLSASAYAYAGEEESTLAGSAEFLLESSTVCLDVHPGSPSRAPHFVLWRDGVGGADCSDLESLTLDNAVAREVWWGGAEVGALNDTTAYFYQTGGPATVIVSTTPALDESDFLPFECSTTVTDVATFAELCAIDGAVRHVQIDGLHIPTQSTAQWVFGFEAAPTTSAPPVGANQFRVSLYGGHSGPTQQVISNFGGTPGPTWSDALFPGTSSLGTATGACFDLLEGSETESPALVVWVDGVNAADCDDWSTLSRTSALGVVTEFGEATGDFLRSSPIFFRKTSATDATITLTSRTALERANLAQGAGGAAP